MTTPTLTTAAPDPVRELLREVMLEQPVTSGRDTYGDGFSNGLAFAIQQIDLAGARAMRKPWHRAGRWWPSSAPITGRTGQEVSVGVIDPKRFPVVNDRTTTYPLYARPAPEVKDAAAGAVGDVILSLTQIAGVVEEIGTAAAKDAAQAIREDIAALEAQPTTPRAGRFR